MKKIISMTTILACLTFFAYAQTTQLEYNYITNGQGLKSELLKGNIRAGYSMEEIGTESGIVMAGIQRNSQLYYFKKGGVNQAFILHCWDTNNNNSYYCIPTSNANATIWDSAFKFIAAAGKE